MPILGELFGATLSEIVFRRVDVAWLARVVCVGLGLRFLLVESSVQV